MNNEEKKQIQKQLSQLIQQDVIKIITDYSNKSLLNLDLIVTLIQDINLLKTYDVKYIHDEQIDEIIALMKNELNGNNSARVVALLSAFDYLQNTNQEFKKLIFINLSLRVPIENFLESFSFFNVLASSVEELFEQFILYIFNDNFLEVDETIQIDTIYKLWGISLQVFHDNEASSKAYELLKPLFNEALKKEKTEVAFWLYYTPLHYFHSGTGNNIDELNEKFKNEIEKPLEQYILNKLLAKYNIIPNNKNINKNGKIKVAFVMQRIIRHSTNNVLYSLIKNLMALKNDKYEFILYDLSFPEAGGSDKEFVEEFKELGIKYINIHEEIFGINGSAYSLLEKCIKTREILIKNKIDILIGLHTRVEYIFLYATRTCPIQIYWYHSSNAQYDIQGLDFRIKHGDFVVNEVTHDKFNFLQFGDLIEKEKLNPSIDKVYINHELEKFPSDSVKIGTIGRLSKVDSIDYITMIDDILVKNPNVIYIAAGYGDTSSIKEKISVETLNRWYFPGSVNAHIYGHIIDIWPNTFPHPQGLSTLEIMAKGKSVLTMKNDLHDFELQDKYNKQRTDKFKDYPLNVKNVDEYKRTLNFLINNKEARDLMGKFNLEYIEKNYYDSSKSINRFYEILEEVVS